VIEFNDRAIQKAETLLGGIESALPKVQYRVINRSIAAAQSVIIKAVPKEYVIDKEIVKNAVNLKYASAVKPIGLVLSSGGTIQLSKFAVSREFIGKRATVKAQVKRDGSPKHIKRAFAAQMKEVGFGANRRVTDQGHIGVYRRVGKSRFPIKELYGPSVPQMVGSEIVMKQAENKAIETMDKRTDHEINRILEGHL